MPPVCGGAKTEKTQQKPRTAASVPLSTKSQGDHAGWRTEQPSSARGHLSQHSERSLLPDLRRMTAGLGRGPSEEEADPSARLSCTVGRSVGRKPKSEVGSRDPSLGPGKLRHSWAPSALALGHTWGCASRRPLRMRACALKRGERSRCDWQVAKSH